MAMIDYADKVELNSNSGIADIYKVKADDMNLIKDVVNTNDDAYQLQVGNIASLTLSANKDLANVIIPFDQITSTSPLLTLSSNGIRIGAGISKVKVSGNVFIYAASTSVAYNWVSIRKNRVDVTSSITSASGRYGSVVFAPKVIDVSEGDIISLYKINSTNDTVRGATNTWLTVEVVE